MATVSDVKLLAQHINALTTRTVTVKLTKEMAIHSDHQSSFMSIVNKRISNIVNEMKDTHDEIDLLQNVIRNNTKALEKLFFTISNTILNSITINTEVKQKLNDLKLGIFSLVEGKLSPLLIKPAT